MRMPGMYRTRPPGSKIPPDYNVFPAWVNAARHPPQVSMNAAVCLSATPATRLRQAYAARLQAGQLRPDPAQSEALERFAILAEALEGYVPSPQRPFWRRWMGAPMPQGIYVWGDVGRGKSMLMDLFFEHAAIPHKKRVHFHSFMRDLHRQIHHLRQTRPEIADPIPTLAEQLAREAWLLCFDEMQILDITDAMLIRRFFELLQAQGVIVVITSNRRPDDLYLNGLQRGQFLPFIEEIKTGMEVIELKSAADYRRLHLQELEHTYLHPDDAAAREWLHKQFTILTHGAPDAPFVVKMPGRQWRIPHFAGEVAMASFEDLCSATLGAADYMELARHASTLLLCGIPILTPAARNESKRFVTLIDVLYEAKVKLLVTAAAGPDGLYPTGDGAFEFARTASRLIEMQSPRYIETPWVRPVEDEAA